MSDHRHWERTWQNARDDLRLWAAQLRIESLEAESTPQPNAACVAYSKRCRLAAELLEVPMDGEPGR